MQQIIKNQFFIAILVYLFIVSLTTLPALSFFQKIRLANEGYKEQMTAYQNLNIRKRQFIGNFQKMTCNGNLFFQAGAPVTAIHLRDNYLYLSQADNQLVVINLITPEHPTRFPVPVLTDIYSDTTDIYGTDFFNDRVIRLVFEKEEVVVEKVYPKIGRASSLTRDTKGYFYVSGYVSGNISKILGRDGFFFLPDLNKIVDLELITGHLVVARYDAQPTLISINLTDGKQTVIEEKRSISSLAFDGETLWAVYDQAGQSQIGKVTSEALIDDQVLDCPFPVKVSVGKDRVFYTSLDDSEGKVYWINKNLQKNGK
ncbi:hypothetical protein HYU45_02370 [Candidatus Daviesbacteria bacterium]|nr:hypothetical protein [Candidatus Daviesbacteria bacterium]